jgi:hypothetical protein
MMRCLILSLLTAFIAVPAAAQQRIYNLPAGQYLITGDVRAVGPVISPDSPVVPPVYPVVPSTKAAAIKAAAEAATSDPQRATTASNLASVMGLVKNQVDAGTLKDYQSIAASVNWLWDQVTVGKTATWLPVKTLVGQHLAELAQQGARPEEFSGYLADAEKALSGSLNDLEKSESADDPMMINMDMLMKLFEFFVKYILPMIIKS